MPRPRVARFLIVRVPPLRVRCARDEERQALAPRRHAQSGSADVGPPNGPQPVVKPGRVEEHGRAGREHVPDRGERSATEDHDTGPPDEAIRTDDEEETRSEKKGYAENQRCTTRRLVPDPDLANVVHVWSSGLPDGGFPVFLAKAKEGEDVPVGISDLEAPEAVVDERQLLHERGTTQAELVEE